MDTRNVTVLRCYEECAPEAVEIYIDEAARDSLGAEWNESVQVRGRRVCNATIKPLHPIDQDGRIARITPKAKELLMIEYGENLLLSNDS